MGADLYMNPPDDRPELHARVKNLEDVLEEIANINPLDLIRDPGLAQRIAREALY